MTAPSAPEDGLRVFLAALPDAPGRGRAEASRIGRALAARAVERLTGRPGTVERDPRGRPLVRWTAGPDGDPPPEVSISHCPGWVGVAVARAGRVGLDLEPAGRVPARVARRTMAAADAALLAQLDGREAQRAATRHWTAAEALAKADGAGLALLLSRAIPTGLQHTGHWGPYAFAVSERPDGPVCALAHDGDADLPRRLAAATVVDPGAVGARDGHDGEALSALSIGRRPRRTR